MNHYLSQKLIMRHSSSLPHTAVSAYPHLFPAHRSSAHSSLASWFVTNYTSWLTIFSFINVSVVSLLFCFLVTCVLKILFALYFLWMGSHPCPFLYTGIFFLLWKLKLERVNCPHERTCFNQKKNSQKKTS